jgi:hypothetical protein
MLPLADGCYTKDTAESAPMQPPVAFAGIKPANSSPTFRGCIGGHRTTLTVAGKDLWSAVPHLHLRTGMFSETFALRCSQASSKTD